MNSQTKNAMLALLAIIAVAAAIWSALSWFNSRETSTDQGYSGEPISQYSVTDFNTVTETNQEGIKVDEDGFIPVANDGGPIFLDPLPESADPERVESEVCDAAHDLVTHRSRENRNAMYEHMKNHQDRIEFDPLREAVAGMTGYDFNNPTIEPVLQQCQ